MNFLGQFANPPAPVNPAALLTGPGNINPAMLSSFMTLSGMAGGNSRQLIPTSQAPMATQTQIPAEFSRAPNPYFAPSTQVINSAASAIAAAATNPYAFAQLMYGTNAGLNWGQQQQAVNFAANPLGIPSVGALAPPFTGDVESLAHTIIQQQQGGNQIQAPQASAQLMTGEALTRATNVASSVWPSVFQQAPTAVSAPANGINSSRGSPAHGVDHGPNCTLNALRMAPQMYENDNDHGTGNGNAIQLQSLM